MRPFFESPIFIFLFFLFILATYALALWFELYYAFWWLDTVHHFLGGLWVAAFGNFFLKRRGFSFSGAILFLMLIGLVALAGILWEFTEFVWDRYIWHPGFTYLPGIYEDTLSDFFFDLFGGVAGSLLIL